MDSSGNLSGRGLRVALGVEMTRVEGIACASGARALLLPHSHYGAVGQGHHLEPALIFAAACDKDRSTHRCTVVGESLVGRKHLRRARSGREGDHIAAIRHGTHLQMRIHGTVRDARDHQGRVAHKGAAGVETFRLNRVRLAMGRLVQLRESQIRPGDHPVAAIQASNGIGPHRTRQSRDRLLRAHVVSARVDLLRNKG